MGMLASVLSILLVGCPLPWDADDEKGEEETGSTPECPYDIESFCLYEFGGPCPTYEEAAAMTCNGYHFDTTGAGTAPSVTDGHEECPDPIVSCKDEDDPNVRTRIYFPGMGDS